MNDFDEFAEIALTILLVLTLRDLGPHLPGAVAHRPRIPTPQPTQTPLLIKTATIRHQPHELRASPNRSRLRTCPPAPPQPAPRTSPHSTVPNQKKLHLCELKTTTWLKTLSGPGPGLLGCQ
jgi:hypothetical protein